MSLLEPILRVSLFWLVLISAWCRRGALPSVFVSAPHCHAFPFWHSHCFPHCPFCFCSGPQLGPLFPSMRWGNPRVPIGLQRGHNLKYVCAPRRMLDFFHSLDLNQINPWQQLKEAVPGQYPVRSVLSYKCLVRRLEADLTDPNSVPKCSDHECGYWVAKMLF